MLKEDPKFQDLYDLAIVSETGLDDLLDYVRKQERESCARFLDETALKDLSKLSWLSVPNLLRSLASQMLNSKKQGTNDSEQRYMKHLHIPGDSLYDLLESWEITMDMASWSNSLQYKNGLEFCYDSLSDWLNRHGIDYKH
jgi:hypothetical protein